MGNQALGVALVFAAVCLLLMFRHVAWKCARNWRESGSGRTRRQAKGEDK